MAEERFATKEEILTNLKKAYKANKLLYKDYMLQVKKTEKYYDEWKAEYERARYGNTSSDTEIDMTNEELAIGKRLTELQTKKETVEEQENTEETPTEEVFETVEDKANETPTEEVSE